MPATVYQAPLRRTALLTLGAIGFVAASIWLLVTHQSVRADITGAVGVLFFGWAGAVSSARLIRRKPELVITDEGLSHRTWGRVSWSEVRAVAISQVMVRNTRQQMIEVVLHDPDGYVKRASPAARTLMRANRRFGFSPINLSAVVLPVPLTDVLAAMKRHRPDLVVNP
ncbi:STM3941 family protein [Dactylosporangium sp. McL0621]|uniref:STM3941 family protein n=1 Tax=Dactylosporangium sp. McL0621 TaxID=3415678 RepID=UPI003CEFDED1